MTNRTIATAPGEPTIYQDLTPTELAEYNQKKLDWRSKAGARKVVLIKDKASKLILGAFPEWKQRNAIARSMELSSLGTTASLDETKELEELQGIWNWVKSVRSYGNDLEDTILASTEPDSINIDTGWPTL